MQLIVTAVDVAEATSRRATEGHTCGWGRYSPIACAAERLFGGSWIFLHGHLGQGRADGKPGWYAPVYAEEPGTVVFFTLSELAACPSCGGSGYSFAGSAQWIAGAPPDCGDC